MTERRKGTNNTTEVKKESKNGNKKEEKIKLKIMHSCSYGNRKETKVAFPAASLDWLPRGPQLEPDQAQSLYKYRVFGIILFEKNGVQRKERTELRKEHMWQCAFRHVEVPPQYFGFL